MVALEVLDDSLELLADPDWEPVDRGYETVPPEHDDSGRHPIYELAPERIRRCSEQEVAELRERRQRERAERYRDVYRLLTLRVVAHRAGTLEVSGSYGRWSSRPSTDPLTYCPARATPTGRDRQGYGAGAKALQ